MKKLLSLIIFLVPFLLFAGDWDGAEVVKKEVWKMSPLFFIIASLFIGIICKHFLKSSNSFYSHPFNYWFNSRSYSSF